MVSSDLKAVEGSLGRGHVILSPLLAKRYICVGQVWALK